MSFPFRKTTLALALAGASLAATAQVSINDGLDGNWYNPATTGSGVSIDVLPQADGGALLYGVMFDYDSAGKPVWYTFLGDLAKGENVVEGVTVNLFEKGSEAVSIGTVA
ncbi:MAG: hypothetical protein WCY72_10240, partial [Lysobacteraceae bacterium]